MRRTSLLPHIKCHLKSRNVWTANSLVTKCVTWQHEVLWAADGKPAVYDKVSVAIYLQGYLVVMEDEKESIRTKMSTQFKDLMSDSQLYRWEKI